ncbi:MAG TPA: pilus assembly protein TadG-related protein [Pirellulales bacterium]|nr:pilus assembly protein TadG-related protein [Pirellulales bacterium]
MRVTSRDRRGVAAVLVAISLVALIGIAAIALDGGLLLDNHQRTQAAADAAAMAAAVDLANQYAAGGDGSDPTGKAKTSAQTNAAGNGYNNDGTSSVVTVNIPPTSGNYVGKAGYAEVIVQYNQKRGLSGIFGASALPVSARAVAKGITGNIGILILDPSINDSCEIDGNVNILSGGQIYVNSTASGSCVLANTAKLSCGGLNLAGTLQSSGSVSYTNGGGLNYYSTPVADPLANIPEPTTAGLTNHNDVNINSNRTLDPGIYHNITIGPGGAPVVTLNPGIYYLSSGGSLKLNGGSLKGTGVMFFDDTGGDSFLNKAMGPVDITPPTSSSGGTWPTGTSSSTYSGISFWIPRNQTKEVHVESAFSLTMPGTWYAQGGEFDIRPDGSSTVFNIGNYICDQAEWCQGYGGGKSDGIINMNPATAVATLRPTLVE